MLESFYDYFLNHFTFNLLFLFLKLPFKQLLKLEFKFIFLHFFLTWKLKLKF
jgi:hypothetical protein